MTKQTRAMTATRCADPRRKKATAHERRKATAYHEAGHAVIGRVLTLPCGEASIKPDYVEMAWGYSICPDPWACIYEWEKRGKVRSSNAVWIARILQSMAGAEAEKICLGRAEVGDDDDRYQIALMLEEIALADPNRYEARLRKMTRMLVRRHQARIERVARALLAKRLLSAEQIDALVGRSVEDVKMNAPDLAVMHAEYAAQRTARKLVSDRLARAQRPKLELAHRRIRHRSRK